jgi:hypothetical protein
MAEVRVEPYTGDLRASLGLVLAKRQSQYWWYAI